MRYLVVVERGTESWGAYAPDLPGCAVAAESRDEAVELIRPTIELHLEDLREDGETLPEPHSEVEYVDVSAT